MNAGDKVKKFTFLRMSAPKKRNGRGFRYKAIFKCDCGSEKEYDYYSVKNGHTTQCIECARISSGKKRQKHKLLKHPIYRKWQDMKKRCYNPKVDRYKNYGGRGIKVCPEWKDDFMTFYNWCISNGYTEGLQIDRKDVNKDYCPENCRLITRLENGFNKTNTFFVEIGGVKYGLSELLHYNGIPEKYYTIWHGLHKKRTIDFYIQKFNICVQKQAS